MALYEVLYHDNAPWLVGETQSERGERRRIYRDRVVTAGECYPDNHAGRVISICPVADVESGKIPSLANMADKDHLLVVLDLTPVQLRAVQANGAKIEKGAVVNTTFDDRFGAVATVLRKQFTTPEEIEAYAEDEIDIDGRQFVAISELAKSMLAPTATGTADIQGGI